MALEASAVALLAQERKELPMTTATTTKLLVRLAVQMLQHCDFAQCDFRGVARETLAFLPKRQSRFRPVAM